MRFRLIATFKFHLARYAYVLL